MNPYRTMQQLATSVGVSRRLMFQALAVHRFGCPELVKAAHSGLLAMKHCETLARAMPHDEQRDFLADSGCSSYQGYFFSRPLPLAGFENYFRQQSATAKNDGAA